MKDSREVCGTCRYHKYEEDGWVCENTESENCTDWTEYMDKCEEWEERQ